MPNLRSRSLQVAVSQADRGESPGPTDEQLRQITPSNAAFLTGFPCTEYQCWGTLINGDATGQDAIVCSACETVYYLVAAD